MVEMTPVPLAGGTAIGVTVRLPHTTLLAVATDGGYIMCGALDVRLLDERLGGRGIVAGRAVGVRSIDDLLAARLEDVTSHAAALGVQVGMTGRDALERMQSAQSAAAL